MQCYSVVWLAAFISFFVLWVEQSFDKGILSLSLFNSMSAGEPGKSGRFQARMQCHQTVSFSLCFLGQLGRANRFYKFIYLSICRFVLPCRKQAWCFISDSLPSSWASAGQLAIYLSRFRPDMCLTEFMIWTQNGRFWTWLAELRVFEQRGFCLTFLSCSYCISSFERLCQTVKPWSQSLVWAIWEFVRQATLLSPQRGPKIWGRGTQGDYDGLCFW